MRILIAAVAAAWLTELLRERVLTWYLRNEVEKFLADLQMVARRGPQL